MEPKVIFEDSDLMVLDKPAGITVNKSDTTRDDKTVQDWIEIKLKIKSEKLKVDDDSDFYTRAGIVHRIDKETSGILIVAKNPKAFENLQKQFKERKVKKVYIALSHGKVVPSDGEINVPLGRLPWNRERFGIVAGGRESITKYKVLSIMYYVSGNKKEELSFIELYPETGRTHQIRVHLKHIGHPIFSDLLYGGRKAARQDRKILPRLFLHAQKISFSHPVTTELLSFESQLTPELQEFMQRLE